MDLKSFKLDSSTIPAAPEKKERDPNKKFVFAKGLYTDVKIEAVKEHGPAKGDDTWVNFELKIGDGTRQITHFIMVPTLRFTYGPNASPYPWLSTQRFLNTLGLEIDESNAAKIIPILFTQNLEKLVGLRLNIQVGFKGWYCAKENKAYLLFDEKDKAYCQDGTNPTPFPDYGSAGTYCKDVLKKPYAAFPSITYLNEATTPNDADALKALTKKKEKNVDLDW